MEKTSICPKCMDCSDFESCPECGAGKWRDLPILAAMAVKKLDEKGWAMLGCRAEEVEGGISWVRVEFHLFAPPPRYVDGRTDKMVVSGDDMVVVELKSPTRPDILARSHEGLLGAARVFYDWVADAPPLLLPFAQALCDKCKPQGGDWMFSACRCPTAGGFVRFADGIPAGCPYAAEQVVTSPGRLETALKAFEGWPRSLDALRRTYNAVWHNEDVEG